MRGIVVASGVAGALVLARIGYTRSLIYDFLLWNLFLAWVPLLLALWFQKTKNRWGRRGLAIGWLKQRHGGEKRFSLGWFDEDYLQDGPIIVACGPGRQDRLFASGHPPWAS